MLWQKDNYTRLNNMENWKDIKGYEGLYQVSNLGRVKRVGQKVMTARGFYKQVKERILKQTDINGYLKVSLCKNGKSKSQLIHILVADAFLNNNNHNGKVVDHINNNRKDNRLLNLQVITQRENSSKDRSGLSKYTGVAWHKQDKKWQSSILIDGKQIYLGQFDNELRASIAYQFALNQINNLIEII